MERNNSSNQELRPPYLAKSLIVHNHLTFHSWSFKMSKASEKRDHVLERESPSRKKKMMMMLRRNRLIRSSRKARMKTRKNRNWTKWSSQRHTIHPLLINFCRTTQYLFRPLRTCWVVAKLKMERKNKRGKRESILESMQFYLITTKLGS